MNTPPKDLRKAALQAASDWLIRLQDDDVPATELEAWALWMAASPDHASAFDDLAALWAAAGTLDPAALDAARATPAPAPAPASTARTGRRPRRAAGRWLAVAASAAVFCVAGLWALQQRAPAGATAQTFATAIGEQRRVVLADGSTLELDAASQVQVRYDARQRDVALLRGRAHFSVAHEPRRPFVVDAEGVRSRALGTRFSVDRDRRDTVTVVVDEGRVQVDNGHHDRYEAGRGEMVRFDPRTGLQAPQTVNAELAMAWRQGEVVYQGEPLSRVIDDLNRYSATPIRLQDAALGELRVTGRWELAGIDRWVDGLARALRLRVQRDTDRILLLRTGTASSGGLADG
ncbi:FecR family protein [Stenotrophomonas mori]|uniref:FecR domain-containing protein n=1 Tax=Stenotrophomonas mori TaxID=2871096 RepID=A0ABT0SJL7_9GAMM|nr:FecR domain-containing protein [Stenotrophomonas mori]MCL7715531.1 FecR domain-containing protein [Stenotrophomonas mori]